MTTQTHLGTALITGASSGIGAVYADRLAARGYDLILVARNRARLETLARKLGDTHRRSVEIISADLTDATDLARIEAVLREHQSITTLVNNAGFGSVAPLLQADIAKMQEMIALNVTALTRLTYAAAPALVQRGGGTIINISSVVGIAPEVLNGVYGATKAFVLALSQSLHHELAAKGLRVQAVLPGATATEFWDVLGHSVDKMPAEIVMTADNLVDAALVGLDAGELVTIPALPDIADWNVYEQARQKMMPNLSRSVPAARYGLTQAA